MLSFKIISTECGHPFKTGSEGSIDTKSYGKIKVGDRYYTITSEGLTETGSRNGGVTLSWHNQSTKEILRKQGTPLTLNEKTYWLFDTFAASFEGGNGSRVSLFDSSSKLFLTLNQYRLDQITSG